jgi:hypothetical protein
MTGSNDRELIAARLAAYFHIVDVGDRALAADQYTADGQFTGGDGTFVGREQLHAFFTAAGTGRDGRKVGGGMHILSPPHIRIDGDEAIAWTRMIYVVPSDDGPRIAVVGAYEDTMRRVDGEWLIAVHRRL